MRRGIVLLMALFMLLGPALVLAQAEPTPAATPEVAASPASLGGLVAAVLLIVLITIAQIVMRIRGSKKQPPQSDAND